MTLPYAGLHLRGSLDVLDPGGVFVFATARVLRDLRTETVETSGTVCGVLGDCQPVDNRYEVGGTSVHAGLGAGYRF